MNVTLNYIDEDFIRLLDQFLSTWKNKVSSERWGSSPQHQEIVNPGVKASWHTVWRAVDLTFDNPDYLLPAAQDAKRLGFGGIEVDLTNKHLHLDNRPTIWHVIRELNGHETPLEAHHEI